MALALGAAALRPAPREPACEAPQENRAAGGWTLEVTCGGPAGALRGPARLLFGQGVDPGRADAATLEALPGIGPRRARALVEARGRTTFCDPAALEGVPGIGPKTRAALEPWLAFESDGCGDRP